MTRHSRLLLVAIVVSCSLGFAAPGWGQRSTTASTAPAAAPVASPASRKSLTLDQENATPWREAWTNLVNDARQTFTPSLPRLAAVEVELVLANPGPQSETVGLTVFDADGEPVAGVSRDVAAADCAHVLFVFPHDIDVTPGEVYSIRLRGGTTFGWKYVVGGYAKGSASFNGHPLLSQARSTFLFRTFGPRHH